MKQITFSKYSRTAAAAASVFVLTVGGATASLAQKTAPIAAPVFGSVDLQKCAQESKGRQESEDQLRAFAAGLDKALQRLAGGSSRFLAEPDMRELSALYEKDPASDADKKRIQALEAQGDAGGAELSRLQQVPAQTDAEKKRFAGLTAQQQKGDGILQAIRETYSGRLAARREELSNKYTGQIRDAVGKIAKDKGLTIVFDSQFALYTANDITPDVIKQLNK